MNAASVDTRVASSPRRRKYEELRLLYDLALLATDQSPTIGTLLERVAELLGQRWPYRPGIGARIIIGNIDARSEAFERAATMLAVPIASLDDDQARLELHDRSGPAEAGAFRPVERSFLRTVAEQLPAWVENRRSLLVLAERNRQIAASERRERHLGDVLRAVRAVNRLIARERQAQPLIEKVCEALAASRGFTTCSVVLRVDQRIRATASAGDAGKLAKLRRMLEAGELPDCIGSAMTGGRPVLMRDPLERCVGCPASVDHRDLREVLAIRLEHQGHVLGAILVAFPPETVADPEEIGILQELADDLAQALRSQDVEADLRASEARFRAAFDHASVGRTLTLPDGRLGRVNGALCKMLGYTAEELERMNFADITHPDDLDRSRRRVERILSGEQPRDRFETRYVHRDGHVVWTDVSTTLVHDDHGAPLHFITDIVDITSRKKAEESLRQTEEFQRAMIDCSPVALYCVAPDGHVMSWNSSAQRLFGWRAEEVVGRPLPIVPPDKREEYDSLRRLGQQEGGFMGKELIRQRKDGSEVAISLSTAPIRDSRGKTVGLMAAAMDITARRVAEEQTRRSGRRLETLTRAVQELSLTRSFGEIVHIVRTAGRELTGADEAAFVLRSRDQCRYLDEDAVPPHWNGQTFPTSECISGWSMAHREPVLIEDVAADPRVPGSTYEGQLFKSLVIVPIRTAEPVGAIGCYWAEQSRPTRDDVEILQALADATSVAMESVRFMQRIEDEKARTRAIYDHLPNPTMVWEPQDGDFLLSDLNEAARVLLNADLSALVGASARDFLTDFPGLEEDLQRCREDGGVLRREAGSQEPGLESSRSLVLTYGLMPSGAVILHVDDVTEQRQIEAQLAVARRIEAIGRLAGGVAHDFNNLLSVIGGCADLAADAITEGHPGHADIVEIQKATQRAADMTAQLLAFSRSQVLEPRPISINQVIPSIASMLERLLGENIRIDLRLADALGTVLADPGQLEQVIMNLAVNAMDAMPDGGSLVIETSDVAVDHEQAERNPDLEQGDHVRITVSDDGIGMQPSTLARIFEPFFTTKPRGKGTGLGLATVYGIIRQSGGAVQVHSEPGVGTTFEIFLPRISAEAEGPVPRNEGANAGGSESVLIVEDEETVRRVTARILSRSGYRVQTAADGDAALSIVGSGEAPLDLLLTDLVMPKMSGRELSERLRAIHPGLKVLFMSGYTEDVISQYGELDPDTRFIGKPFRAAELSRKVRSMLDRPAS